MKKFYIAIVLLTLYLAIPNIGKTATALQYEQTAVVKISGSDLRRPPKKIKRSERLEVIDFTEKITSRMAHHFQGLKSIDLRQCDGLKKICPGAFECCRFLEGVHLPPGVLTIGARAFRNCFHLGSLNLEDCKDLRELGCNAFEGCAALVELRFPGSLEIVGKECFMYCDLLESVDFSPCVNLRLMGEPTFDFCEKLKSVMFSQRFHFGEGIFVNCPSLRVRFAV
ncbi:MAG: leucine-rich repeat domain-containing protein [Holosporales bacterium]|jgi:hypothetical protein|nr:leucine-rich repeat domain-containing protein [Holosporales bacterium]